MNYLLVVQVFVRTPTGSVPRGNQQTAPGMGRNHRFSKLEKDDLENQQDDLCGLVR
jgi:hypothetical protein